MFMKIRVLSWNVRGVNDKDKQKVIRAFLRLNKVDLVCLQETKIQDMFIGVVRNLAARRCADWGTLNFEGALGVIVVFWDNRVL